MSNFLIKNPTQASESERPARAHHPAQPPAVSATTSFAARCKPCEEKTTPEEDCQACHAMRRDQIRAKVFTVRRDTRVFQVLQEGTCLAYQSFTLILIMLFTEPFPDGKGIDYRMG